MADSSRRPATIRDLGDGELGLWVHYDDRHHATALPGARWDKGLRCWRVPYRFRPEAERLIDRLNRRSTSAAGPSTGAVPLAEVTAQMLRVLPDRMRNVTYRALATAWHPDRGGDTTVMQALNQAWSGVRR